MTIAETRSVVAALPLELALQTSGLGLRWLDTALGFPLFYGSQTVNGYPQKEKRCQATALQNVTEIVSNKVEGPASGLGR